MKYFPIHIFDTEAATTIIFETYFFPPDFEYPEPEVWFPEPPPSIDNTVVSQNEPR